jgi:hypothetical protein
VHPLALNDALLDRVKQLDLTVGDDPFPIVDDDVASACNVAWSTSLRVSRTSELQMVTTICPFSSHSPLRTGSLALVAHHTMWKPRTGSRGSSTAITSTF